MWNSALFISFFPLILRYFSLTCLATTKLNITADQSALLALKARVTSDPNSALQNWRVSVSACDWVGITCGSRHRRVTALNVSYMDIAGEIPSELGNLSFLITLDMRSNRFTGTLGIDFSHLRKLRYIRLSYNNFTREVPSSFAFLPELQFLALANNTFTHLNSFLDALSTKKTRLEALDMPFNNLQGNIPESIGNTLYKLMRLNLGANKLSGSIPSSLGNMSSLEFLDLSKNSITRSIPENLGNCYSLNWLSMGQNQLTGSVSLGIFNISTLQTLSFSFNSLSGTLPDDMCIRLPLLNGLYLTNTEIYGRIPSNISACLQLQILGLAMNNFAGTIPLEIGQLYNLVELEMTGNMLTGNIPIEISNLEMLENLLLRSDKLTGIIPVEIDQLQNLRQLDLSVNMLNGAIPSTIFNLSSLRHLDLDSNNFTGVIPQGCTKLTKLEVLNLGVNRLSGSIPFDIFNISGLSVLSLALNNLSGNLPPNICYLLPNLEQLYLGANNFYGVIPNSIINCSKLTLLDLTENRFTGAIPNSIEELRLLKVLNLAVNDLTNEPVSSEFSFITSLVNSRYLTDLRISGNPLNGILPTSLGNLSSSLHVIDAFKCQINCRIPDEIGNLSGLVQLYLDGNNLAGSIPKTFQGLQNLQRLYLGSNRISGFVPNILCELTSIGVIHLSQNQLKGSIPECFGNISSLREIRLGSNNLISSIPESIWKLQDLLILDISSNSFGGEISPQIGNLKVATYINLSGNQFSNYLPNTFQGMQSLTQFSLSSNRFEGPIPKSMGAMLNLAFLDLSHNNLSGTIPKFLEGLTQLEYFNVSFNHLSGEIPTGGPFSNFTSHSFMHNTALCGLPKYQVPSCKSLNHKSKMRKVVRTTFLIPGVVFLVFIVIMVLIIRYLSKKEPQTASHTSFPAGIERFSYYEILHATNGFSESNLLRGGCYGSVYKCTFGDGRSFAVKVLNMQVEGAKKTFLAECEVQRNLRHKNLTKVISSISNEEFKAIVLEYMPNGSLEKWLHYNENSLTMMHRLNIMIDAASALEYLHHGYATLVVHCDLKPSNILLDENMIAHLSDFGTAKLFGEGEIITHTMTLATMGYMAPEYGLDGLVLTRGDVYSYGIILLETFTGKQPSDEMFSGELSLKHWVRDSLPNGISGIIDSCFIRAEEKYFTEKMHYASSILELALGCLEHSPNERINMQDMVAELKKIKKQFAVLNTEVPE